MQIHKTGVRSVVVVVCFLFSFAAKAQQLEFGIWAGTTNYSGELSGFQIKQQFYKPAFGLLTRYNLSPRFTLKGSTFYGGITGADSISKKAKEKSRNLSFESELFEFSGQVEFNLVPYNLKTKNGKHKKIIPYVFTGIAIFNFRPKAKFGGQWWDLQPLSTEGQGTTQYQQRKKYSLTQLSVPLGVGIKMELSDRFNVGFEVGARYTFTDYLDDVSKTYVDTSYLRAAYGPISARLADRSNEAYPSTTPPDQRFNKVPGTARGNSANTDWYYFGGISITYRIKRAADPCPKFY